MSRGSNIEHETRYAGESATLATAVDTALDMLSVGTAALHTSWAH